MRKVFDVEMVNVEDIAAAFGYGKDNVYKIMKRLKVPFVNIEGQKHWAKAIIQDRLTGKMNTMSLGRK